MNQLIDSPSPMLAKRKNFIGGTYWAKGVTADQLSELTRDARCADGVLVFGGDFDSGELFFLDGAIAIFSTQPMEEVVADPKRFLSTLDAFDQANLLSVRGEMLEQGKVEKIVDLIGPDERHQTVRVIVTLVEKWDRRFFVGSAMPIWRLDETKIKADAFRLAMERAHEGLAVTDHDGNFVYVNKEHLQLFGYSTPAELLGKSWRTLYGQPEIDIIERVIFPELLQKGYWTGTIEASHKSGAVFTEALTLSLLPGGGIVCNCRDCTKEIEVADQLRRSETTIREFFNALSESVFIRRIGGPYTFVNDAACRALGVGASELLGKHELSMLPPAVLERFRSADEELMFDSQKRQQDFDVNVEINGRSYIVAAKKFCIQPDSQGKFSHVCTIVADVTERRRLEATERQVAERRREYMQMQREFISMVSHEFRTPLTAIQGTHYLLSKKLNVDSKPDSDDLKRMLNLQERALTTLKELVDQVLLLNRIEHMTTDTEPVPTNLREFLSRVVEGFNLSMEGDRVVLESELPRDWAPAFNEGLMRAALENLISNGLKYSPVDSRVRVLARQNQAGWSLEVIDQGRGIPAEQHAKLFAPFFRASNVGSVPGTGLGLTIVKRVVDFHSGKVAFASAAGSGTTFTLTFPAPSSPAPISTP